MASFTTYCKKARAPVIWSIAGSADVCVTFESAGPPKTNSACRDRIAAWKQEHQAKDRLYKRKYADEHESLFKTLKRITSHFATFIASSVVD